MEPESNLAPQSVIPVKSHQMASLGTSHRAYVNQQSSLDNRAALGIFKPLQPSQQSQDRTNQQISEDMSFECVVCMMNMVTDTSSENTRIWQCQEGHCYCDKCYHALGGAETPCSTCNVRMGNIRNRVLESWRERAVESKLEQTDGKVDIEQLRQQAHQAKLSVAEAGSKYRSKPLMLHPSAPTAPSSSIGNLPRLSRGDEDSVTRQSSPKSPSLSPYREEDENLCTVLGRVYDINV